MDPHRAERVSECIREELEELIGFEISDPRVVSVNITDVLLSPDIRHARIRVAPIGTAEEQAATIEALNHAKQYLKNQLADRLGLYRTPDLVFEASLSPGLAARAPHILKRIERGRPKS